MTKFSVRQQKCFIRSNKNIKEFVFLRMGELGLSVGDIIKEGNKHRMKFSQSMFSKWINAPGHSQNSLTQKQVLWLCHRLGIEIHLKIEMKEDFSYEEARVDTQKFINRYNEL